MSRHTTGWAHSGVPDSREAAIERWSERVVPGKPEEFPAPRLHASGLQLIAKLVPQLLRQLLLGAGLPCPRRRQPCAHRDKGQVTSPLWWADATLHAQQPLAQLRTVLQRKRLNECKVLTPCAEDIDGIGNVHAQELVLPDQCAHRARNSHQKCVARAGASSSIAAESPCARQPARLPWRPSQPPTPHPACPSPAEAHAGAALQPPLRAPPAASSRSSSAASWY